MGGHSLILYLTRELISIYWKKESGGTITKNEKNDEERADSQQARNKTKMWVNGKYIPKAHPLHKSRYLQKVLRKPRLVPYKTLKTAHKVRCTLLPTLLGKVGSKLGWL